MTAPEPAKPEDGPDDELSLHDDLGASDVGEGGGSPGIAHPGDPAALYLIPPQHRLWGVVTPISPSTVTQLAGAPRTSLLQTESYTEAVDWHVEISASATTTGVFGNGVICVFVTTSQGQVQQTRAYFIKTTNPRVIHVNSRYLQISASWFSYNTGSKGPIQMQVSAGVGGLVDRPLSSTLPVWVIGSASGASETPTSGIALGSIGGQLQAFTASIVTMTGDAVCFLQFFDATAAPSLGDHPIWVSPPFTAANQSTAYDDSREPQIAFSNGVTWALSSTPATFTASTGSGVAMVNCKIGQ